MKALIGGCAGVLISIFGSHFGFSCPEIMISIVCLSCILGCTLK